jgi:hypothetical protein
MRMICPASGESADPLRSFRRDPRARYHAGALRAGALAGIAPATRHFEN